MSYPQFIPSRIQVAARLRPALAHEYCDTVSVRVEDPTTLCVVETNHKFHHFKFDNVFDMDATQEEVYNTAVVDVVESALDGSNVTVMASGPTGAGKTFTLIGTQSDPGMLSMTLQDLLRYRSQVPSDLECHISLSAVEVYNDEVLDLLKDKTVLKIRELGGEDTVMGMTYMRVENAQSLQRCLAIAASHRAVSATAMNDVSSRSHAIFFVDFVQKPKYPPARRPSQNGSNKSISSSSSEQRSRLAFVDLAGSERVKTSGAAGQTLLEAQAINKSLSALASVVHALHANQRHIPFRDSKLTRILKSSMVDLASRVLLIANVAATTSRRAETCVALRFADNVKNLKVTNIQNTVASVMSHMELPRAYQQASRTWAELCSEVRLAREAISPIYISEQIMTTARERALRDLRPMKAKESDARLRLEAENARQADLLSLRAQERELEDHATTSSIRSAKKSKRARMILEERAALLRELKVCFGEESTQDAAEDATRLLRSYLHVRNDTLQLLRESERLRYELYDTDVSVFVRNLVNSLVEDVTAVGPRNSERLLGPHEWRRPLDLVPKQSTPLEQLQHFYEHLCDNGTAEKVLPYLHRGCVLCVWTSGAGESSTSLMHVSLSPNGMSLVCTPTMQHNAHHRFRMDDDESTNASFGSSTGRAASVGSTISSIATTTSVSTPSVSTTPLKKKSSSWFGSLTTPKRSPAPSLSSSSTKRPLSTNSKGTPQHVSLPTLTAITLHRPRVFSLSTSSHQIFFMTPSISDLECWVLGIKYTTALEHGWAPPMPLPDDGRIPVTMPPYMVAACCRYHVDLAVADSIIRRPDVQSLVGANALGKFCVIGASHGLDAFQSSALFGVLAKHVSSSAATEKMPPSPSCASEMSMS
eukprot:PhM_4_TR4784/c0_g1_i1/m.80086